MGKRRSALRQEHQEWRETLARELDALAAEITDRAAVSVVLPSAPPWLAGAFDRIAAKHGPEPEPPFLIIVGLVTPNGKASVLGLYDMGPELIEAGVGRADVTTDAA